MTDNHHSAGAAAGIKSATLPAVHNGIDPSNYPHLLFKAPIID